MELGWKNIPQYHLIKQNKKLFPCAVMDPQPTISGVIIASDINLEGLYMIHDVDERGF